jgi:serine/threonine protein kinase
MWSPTSYQVIELLTEGADALLYRATRVEDGKPVILKTLPPIYSHVQAQARLRQEYEITQQLDLSGVLGAYSLEHYQNTPFLVLEDCAGQTLSSELKAGPLALKQFFDIAIALVEVVGSIHQQHIIHKHINPASILVSHATRQIKLTDFSIAIRLLRHQQHISRPEGVEGTLAYISPEQTGRMNRPLDYRSDFYSLGATFYEMLTGTVPFPADDPLEVLHGHIARAPRPPHEIVPTVPLIVSHIVLKLLAKSAEDRYQSAYGLKVDLEACRQQWIVTGEIARAHSRRT